MDTIMTTTSHTPEPWIEGQEGNLRVYGPDNTEHAGLIAVVYKGRGNVRLIAQAPAMLALLKRIDDEVPHSSACAVFHRNLAECDCFQRDVTDIIAQAEGRQP